MSQYLIGIFLFLAIALLHGAYRAVSEAAYERGYKEGTKEGDPHFKAFLKFGAAMRDIATQSSRVKYVFGRFPDVANNIKIPREGH